MRDNRFREARWRRAGATVEQIDELRAAFDDLTIDEQTAENTRVDSVSDNDLATELTAGSDDPSDGRIDDILARVGDDREQAAVVRSHEAAKPKPRPKLLAALDAVIAGEDG